MPALKCFIKEPTGEKYPGSLAWSVHFSFREEGKDGLEEDQELNFGYGMLFARGSIRPDNTIEPKALKAPCIFCAEGEYHIFAQECEEDGTEVRDGKVILFRTRDFVTFAEQEKVSREEYAGELAGAKPEIAISEEMLRRIKNRWLPVSRDKMDQRMTPEFPMAVGFADPVVFSWEGKWYFLATNDNLNDIGLYVRRADSVKGLFAEDVETACILDYNEEKEFIQTFWAPEFHVIGGEAYILFAVGGRKWAPQCHMMKLKKGGDILKSSDWKEPVRVRRKDGSFLTEDGITLDMTYFQAGGVSYLVWSYRFGIGTPLDSGSMLYIATTDEKKPWVLTSDPVLLSRPLFGWENTAGTINNEGPYALILKDKVYLAFSGGSANWYSYAVGYLIADAGDDLLCVDSWRKEPSPVLCSTFIPGIDGPGHNSFFTDEDGRLMVAYHAQETERYNCRCTTMHPVMIGEDGFPFLGVASK